MNLAVVIVAVWITFGLEQGLRDAFQLGTSPVAPSFVMILLTFIAAWARRPQIMWTALAMGVVADILLQLPAPSGDAIVVLGPNALGYAMAAYTVYIMRAWMFRSSSLAVAVMSVVATIVAGVTALALLKMRSIWDPVLLDSAGTELGQRMGSALYTGVLALVFAPILGIARPLFRFPSSGRSHGLR